MKRKILLGAGLLFLLVIGYYTAAILIARSNTEELVGSALESDRMKLELTDLSKEQLNALLKIQDPGFYTHKGVDFETPGTGVTTISQGLVKMYYFDKFQPGIKKIEQSVIARFAFDPLTPKDTILKLFINEAYLGQENGKPLKGFEDASAYYFGKGFKQLNWNEYLSLIAMIRAPYNFHYKSKQEANLERVERMKKVLSGAYIPKDNSDLFYDRE